MTPTRRSTDHLLPLALVMIVAAALWYAHAVAWDLGGTSPIISYDSAQYALAAREFAWHGRFATPFALPLDLVRHADPPWPLSALQPGLILVEAFIFKVAPAHGVPTASDPRAWLTLILPFMSYLMLGAAGVLGTRHLLAWHAPDSPRWLRAGGPATVGLMLVLDPEAQHFAITGLTEMPFTVLLLAALLGLARGSAGSHPLVFGLLLGVAGLFRANMLWLAPLFALAAGFSGPDGRRVRVALTVLAGYALPLLPWWFYKWRSFGTPAWDVTRFVVWDQVEGRSWFELYHRPSLPDVPHGSTALSLLAAKAWRNLGRLVPMLLEGPRGLWLGALVAWVATRPSRPLAAAALVALAGLALNLLAASVSIPWLRYLFPTRVLAEAAGLIALAVLVQRLSGTSERVRIAIRAVLAVLALAWGTWLTVLAQEEARSTSRERGVPASRTLTALSVSLNEVLRPGETVMSNLGPALAWQTNHPVIALAHTPADAAACRLRHDFRHVVLVFRSAERTWATWREIFERPGSAATVAELRVIHERRFKTADGFQVVWLELGPLPAAVAMSGSAHSNVVAPHGP